MTVEEAFEWATINAGKKFHLKNLAVGNQDVTVIGSYLIAGMVAVELSNGSGWPMTSPVSRNIRWTVDRYGQKERTYQFVNKETLTPVEEQAAPSPGASFARANVGKTLSFRELEGSSMTVKGRVVGYDPDGYVLIEREDRDGWTHQKSDRLPIVWLEPRKDEKDLYWWVRHNFFVPEEKAAADARVPEATAPTTTTCVPMPDFVPGDVVYLKSGGPAMTVDQIDDEDGECLCRWFPAERWQGETSEDYFPPATLTKTRPTTI